MNRFGGASLLLELQRPYGYYLSELLEFSKNIQPYELLQPLPWIPLQKHGFLHDVCGLSLTQLFPSCGPQPYQELAAMSMPSFRLHLELALDRVAATKALEMNEFVLRREEAFQVLAELSVTVWSSGKSVRDFVRRTKNGGTVELEEKPVPFVVQSVHLDVPLIKLFVGSQPVVICFESIEKHLRTRRLLHEWLPDSLCWLIVGFLEV